MAEESPSKPTTPLDRPVREKKSTKIFDPSNVRDSPREFIIEQGKGTQLKEIPNVASKLSKMVRGDEMLETLHSLFYGRRGKAYHFKRNVFQFSGFVWGEGEENKLKGKLKLKEKIEKIKKDDLWRICDMMDVHVSKYDKKEEMVSRLAEFLEAPSEMDKKGKKMEEDEKDEVKTPGKRRKNNDGQKNKEIECAKEEDEGKEEKYEEENEVEAAKNLDRMIKQEKDKGKTPNKRKKKNVRLDEEMEGDKEDEEEEGIEAKRHQRIIKQKKVPAKNLSEIRDKEKEEVEGIEDEAKTPLLSPAKQSHQHET